MFLHSETLACQPCARWRWGCWGDQDPVLTFLTLTVSPQEQIHAQMPLTGEGLCVPVKIKAQNVRKWQRKELKIQLFLPLGEGDGPGTKGNGVLQKFPFSFLWGFSKPPCWLDGWTDEYLLSWVSWGIQGGTKAWPVVPGLHSHPRQRHCEKLTTEPMTCRRQHVTAAGLRAQDGKCCRSAHVLLWLFSDCAP